jgi:hypothetical protein
MEKSMKEVTQLLLDSFKYRAKVHEVAIKKIYQEVFGKTINQNTESIAYFQGKLCLKIISAPLRHELSIGKEKMKKILNDRLGKELIKQIDIF